MFEGIGKYIFGLFIIYLISYFVKKRELSKVFKKANVKPGKAYIPFKCTKELIDLSHSNSRYFSLTLIPFVNVYAYIAIYKDMLTTFGKDPKEAPLYFFMPMVYFTKLGTGPSKVQIHDYDLNNEYLRAQSMLYEPVTGETEKPLYEMTDPGYYVPTEKKEKIVYRVARREKNATNESIKIMDPNAVPEQMPQNTNVFQASVPEVASIPEVTPNVSSVQMAESVPVTQPQNDGSILDIPATKEESIQVQNAWQTLGKTEEIKSSVSNPIPEGPKSVFTDKSLEPDKRHERIVEAKKQEEVQKNPITEAVKGRLQMCPKCGAKLAPGAKVCFLCGTHL